MHSHTYDVAVIITTVVITFSPVFRHYCSTFACCVSNIYTCNKLSFGQNVVVFPNSEYLRVSRYSMCVHVVCRIAINLGFSEN